MLPAKADRDEKFYGVFDGKSITVQLHAAHSQTSLPLSMCI